MKNEQCVSDVKIADNKSGAERNYGIDLFRIFAMFMVVLLHVQGIVKVLDDAAPFSLGYEIIYLINSLVMCGVNCFALISGYVGLNAKHKWSNLVYLWLTALVYSVALLILTIFFQPEKMYGKLILISFMPVTFGWYWYLTAYVGLFALMPILNYALNNADRKTVRNSIIAICFLTCLMSIINKNIFDIDRGTSLLWILILYLVGGYVKKYNPFAKIKKWQTLAIAFGGVFLIWLSKLLIELIGIKIPAATQYSNTFISYISLPMLIVSVAFLEFFSRIKFKKKPKLIALVSPLTFGIYISHTNGFVHDLIEKLGSFANFGAAAMVFATLGVAAALFIACAVIDYIRQLIFKLLKVKPRLEKLENKIREKIAKRRKNNDLS